MDSSSQKRTLFLITSSFPYGEFESFLESEFPFLTDTFDKIFIIHTESSIGRSRVDETDAHVSYIPYLPSRKEKWGYLRLIFNFYLIRELLNLLTKESRFPRLSMVSSAAGALTSGYKLKQEVSSLISQHNLYESQIYAYSYWCNNMATGLALLKAEYPKINCFCRAHAHDVYLERNQHNYLPFRRLIFKKLNQIFFISEHGKKYTEERFGHFKSFSVSHLGVGDGKNNRQQINSNQLHLVSCSTCIAIKRLWLIIEALALVDHTPIHWVHIGGGDQLEYLKQQAHELLDPKPNVTFKFLGRLSNKKTLAYYTDNKVDLFVNTSKHEGIPVSIMEAFAYGIPAIGPEVGGIPEILRNGFNGFLLPPINTPDTLKEVLCQFISMDHRLRSTFSKNAITTWEHRYQAKTNYRNFIRKVTG